MYNAIPLASILFLDIECVSGEATLEEMPEAVAALWRQKAPRIMRVDELNDEESARAFVDRAAVYAEFGKIVCISVGMFAGDGEELAFRVKSYADAEERVLLDEFAALVAQLSARIQASGSRAELRFCGHNIKEFDMPYIGRRMLLHGMTLPASLDLRGKKPWETKHLLDTMEMWSFGDRKNYTSLKLLAALFGIPSPKDDIDGSQVGRVFWEDNDLERIATYCEKDVVATTNVFLAMTGRALLNEERVVYVGR